MSDESTPAKPLDKHILIRCSEDDVTRLGRLKQRLKRAPQLRNVSVSNRSVILEALDALERYLDSEGL